jgi:cytochrome c oxidase assembly factor 4
VSSQENHHKKTKRVNNECKLDIPGQQQNVEGSGGEEEEEEDPIIAKLNKVGCLEAHYKVQDCYFDTKDWRKCVNEVNAFKDCLKEAKKDQPKK